MNDPIADPNTGLYSCDQCGYTDCMPVQHATHPRPSCDVCNGEGTVRDHVLPLRDRVQRCPACRGSGTQPAHPPASDHELDGITDGYAIAHLREHLRYLSTGLKDCTRSLENHGAAIAHLEDERREWERKIDATARAIGRLEAQR